MKTSKKTSKKKRRLINLSKRKVSIDKLKSKTVFTSILNYFEKKQLPILILKVKILMFATKKVNIAMIDANAYCISCKFKRVLVLAVSIRDLQYQVEKKARPETNSKSFILEEYYDLLDIF